MYVWDINEPPACRKWNAYSLIKYAQDNYDTDPGLDHNMIDFTVNGTILTFDADGSITGETTKELVSSDEFVRMIKSKFFTYKFLTPFYLEYSTNKCVDSTDDDNYSNVTMAYRQLFQIWQLWAKDNKKNFGDLYNALYQKYNPINNYDKHSNITLDYKGKETSSTDYTGQETDTLVKSGQETNELAKAGTETHTTTMSGKEKTTNHNAATTDTTAKIPYDGGNTAWKNVEKVDGAAHDDTSEIEYGSSGSTRQDTDDLSFSNNRKDTNTLSFSQRQDKNTKAFSDRNDTTEKSFTNRQDETNEHTFGNIGVTTTQQMAMSSFDLAELAHLKEYIVNDFVKRYLEL